MGVNQDIELIVEKNEKIINAPVRVAFLGFIFFGGSYFALKKYKAGTIYGLCLIVLFLMLIDGASIVDLGLFEFIHTSIDKPYGFLLYCLNALLFSGLWWFTIIHPVNMCKPVFFYQDVSNKTLLYTWFLPFLPYYWQGKFKRGHITGLGFLLFPSLLLILNVFYTQLDFTWITRLNEKILAYVWLMLLWALMMMMISWVSNALEVLQIYHGLKKNLNNYRWILVGLVVALNMFIFVFILKNPEQFSGFQNAFVDFINLLRA